MKRLKGLWLRLPKWLRWIILAVSSFLFFSLIGKGYNGYGGYIFALAVMLVVGFHECGHLLVAKVCGLETKGFWFIPLGGVARINGQAEERWKRFLIAIGGPLAGLILSGIALVIVCFTSHNNIFLKTFAAFLIFINSPINLFNLLCLAWPLDGGRVLWQIAASIFGEKRNWWLTDVAVLMLLIWYLFTRAWMVLVLYFLLFRFWGYVELEKDDLGKPMTKTETAAAILIYLMVVIGFLSSISILLLMGH